jgi:hypothetical protein
MRRRAGPGSAPGGGSEGPGQGTPAARSRRRATPFLLLPVLLVALGQVAGCGTGPEVGGVQGEWVADEERRGDTLIVRSTSGSVWGDTMRLVPELTIGELDGEDPYVFGRLLAVARDGHGRVFVTDGQAREVRVFDPEGVFLRTIGRTGGGPGEYTRPDALGIAPGGELVVRDQQGGRFLVYSPEGDHLRSWPMGGAFSTTALFYIDADGHVLNPDIRRGVQAGNPGVGTLVRYDVGTGEPLDTLPMPTAGTEPPQLESEVRSNGNVMRFRSAVPFHPAGVWSMTADGAVLLGPGDPYVVDRMEPDGTVLRIERRVDPVPVQPAEAGWSRENVARGFRSQDPSWRWVGPDIPDVKPAYQWIGAGVDGTIWVLRHTPGVQGENPAWSPESEADVPRMRWVEPPVADVFDARGRYLGPVRLPEGFDSRRPSVLSLDGPLLVVPHELGYDQLVRYRLEEG